jgi:hypothetical protein
MQTGSSGTLIGWKSGQTTFVPLWDRMEGAWLRTQQMACIESFFLLDGTLLFDGKIRQNAAPFWFGLRYVRILETGLAEKITVCAYPSTEGVRGLEVFLYEAAQNFEFFSNIQDQN